MIKTQKEPFRFLDSQGLEELSPLLSETSYNNLLEELKRLQSNAPPASGLGIYHLNYVPRTTEEALKKAQWLQDRQLWLTRMCSIYEAFSRSDRRKKRLVEKENRNLKEENAALKKDLQRTKIRLQSILGLKKNSSNPESKTKNNVLRAKKRGAPKGHVGRTRKKPETIDKVETVPPPSKCPHCNHGSVLGRDKFTSRFIEDIPPIVKIVIERRYQWGTCSCCKQPVVHSEALNGPQVIIGKNLAAWLAVMRQQMGATYRKLSRHCTEVLGVSLTPSGVFGIVNRVSKKLEPIYKSIEASLPSQEVLHGDETGWKMDGNRWYLWAFCNKQLAYFHLDPGRSAQVPKDIIGEDYAGIMHADFYAAYNFFPRTQRCLVHLLRDIKQELEVDENDKDLALLKTKIKEIIKTGQLLKTEEDSPEKRKKRAKLDETLEMLATLNPANSKAKTLSKRIGRHQQDLLHFADHKDVEFHNNRAERAIRPAVIFRKISFGNRSIEGARNFSILASVMETCRLKNIHLTDFIKTVWNTPKDQVQHICKTLFDTS